MGNLDISTARLVPGPGSEGWLCRRQGAVIWLPTPGSAELVLAFLLATSPSDLLSSVGTHLADPHGAAWPPFALLANREDDLVVFVHGPVEVTACSEAGDTRLYGGDEAGSWLNRLLRDVGSAHAGTTDVAEPLVDLREGVVRAGGFVLAPSGSAGSPGAVATTLGREDAPARPGAGTARAESSSVAARPGRAREAIAVMTPAGHVDVGRRGEQQRQVGAESPTVADQPLFVSDVTVVDADAGAAAGRAARRRAGAAALGRLTWDNGEEHQLLGGVLIGRDVSTDEAVLAGRLLALVPGGQNDSMSRVHAELWPRGTEAVVTDRGSTNGTFVWDEASRAWQRLVAGQPQVLPSGTVLAFGERTATFEGWGPAS